MTNLSQILAVEKGSRASANDAITATYHTIQKPDLFAGIARTYQPKDEDGDEYPAESTKVMFTIDGLLDAVSREWVKLFDITATKDVANTKAVVDVKVDGQTIIAKVPATYLLWLEKQLGDLRTLIGKLPVLDASVDWEYDEASAVYRTPTVETNMTEAPTKLVGEAIFGFVLAP